MRLRSQDLVTRDVDGEVVILDVRSSRYLSVTGVGVHLLELLARDRAADELVASVVEDYDVDPTVAEHDVTAFLADLRAAGLIED